MFSFLFRTPSQPDSGRLADERRRVRPRRSWSPTGLDRLEGRLVLTATVAHPAQHLVVAARAVTPFNLTIPNVFINRYGGAGYYVSGNTGMTGWYPKTGELRVRLYWADSSKHLLAVASTKDSVSNVKAGDHHGALGFHFSRSDVRLDRRPAGAVLVARADPDGFFGENQKDNLSALIGPPRQGY